MEKVILKTDVLITYIDTDKQLLKHVWNEQSFYMRDEDFKNNIIQWCEQVEIYGLAKTIVDTRKFGFSIDPQLQDWYNEVVTPRCYKAGMRKLAFLIPEEMYSELSIEQIFDDQTEIEFKYFVEESDALEWLK